MKRLPQITLFVMLSFALYAVGCDSTTEMGPTASEHQAGDIDIDAVSQSIYGSKNQNKIDICHKRDGNPEYILLNISVNAKPAHIAHGDGQVFDDVPGMPGYIFDEDCVPVEACPCMTLSDLEEHEYTRFREDVTPHLTATTLFEGNDQNLEARSTVLFLNRSSSWQCTYDVAGEPQVFSGGLTAGEVQTCHGMLHRRADDLGLPCAGINCGHP